MVSVATEGCVVIHVPPRDPMSRIKPIYRSANSLPSSRNYSTDCSVLASSVQNVTDESCSDPSMSEQNTYAASSQKPSRRRSRNTGNHHPESDEPDNSVVTVAAEEEVEDRDPKSNAGSPSHDEILSENEDFEVHLTWKRNSRVLLRRLQEISSRGNLSMVSAHLPLEIVCIWFSDVIC